MPIDADLQRDVLCEAQALVKRQCDDLIPRDKNFRQWQEHFYAICRQMGLSRKNGVTSHGLRHERLNEIYREKTGNVSPIKGQQKGTVNRDLDAAARQKVAEVARHCRKSIAEAYVG